MIIRLATSQLAKLLKDNTLELTPSQTLENLERVFGGKLQFGDEMTVLEKGGSDNEKAGN